MEKISQKLARAFILESQLIHQSGPLRGERGALSAIEQLGYLQIDTISVIARAHHHILFTRVPNYRAQVLEKLEENRQIFEYWAHAASYLPMKDFRYSLYPKEKIKAGDGHWRKRDTKWMKWVYGQIKAEGPKMGRDFKKDPSLKYDHAWGGHPVTTALRQLFMEGDIMISGRKGFQKVFDLTERVLPVSVNTSMPTEEEYYQYLIERDLLANGVMRAREVGHLITIPRKKLESLLLYLIESKKLIQIRIDGLPDTYYALKKQWESFELKRRKNRLYILSPFDNLIIQRKRMNALFNFNYTLECYVPEAKRVVGYFSLPLLWGTTFVGQVDLKADRKQKILMLRNLVWEPKAKISDQIREALKSALETFCTFNDCEEIDYGQFKL